MPRRGCWHSWVDLKAKSARNCRTERFAALGSWDVDHCHLRSFEKGGEESRAGWTSVRGGTDCRKAAELWGWGKGRSGARTSKPVQRGAQERMPEKDCSDQCAATAS